MTRNFTYSEARTLTNRHREILDRLEKTGASLEREQKVIASKISASDPKGHLERLMESELSTGVLRLSDSYSASLASDLDRYLVLEERKNAAARVLSYNRENVETLCMQLSSCSNAVSWMFASEDRKREACEAYEELQGMLNGIYGKTVTGLMSVHGKSNVFSGAARNRYIEVLQRIVPSSSAESSCISALLNTCSQLKNRTDEVKAAAGRFVQNVGKAADALIRKEALQVLSGIPAEELNKEGSGFRIKTLKDAGYETLADIYGASKYELAKINGISDEAAMAVRTAVQRYYQEVLKQVSIKLNADDRNEQSTALVTAICNYRRAGASIDRAEELEYEYSTVIQPEISCLKETSSAVRWFCLVDSEKQKAQKAYALLKERTGGDFASSVFSISRDINGTPVSAAEAWEDFNEDSIGYNNVIEKIRPGYLESGESVYGLPEDLALSVQDENVSKAGLKCELRRYQEWGVKYILHQGKVLLGDEMGLGKTVQAIAAMVSLESTGATHFMVVCPASVLANWCKEIEDKSTLIASEIHGHDKEEELEAWKKNGGVAVTTYETTGALTLPEDFRYSMLVVDEAHYIKNPEANRSINVRRLASSADRLLFMTGTALENRVDEMIELVSILNPETAKEVRKIAFMSSAPEFREKLAPVYYRRKREEVLQELPDLIENKEWCELGKEEKKAYQKAVLSGNFMAMRRVSWDVENLENSSKAKRLMELIDEAAEDGRKILVFSFFTDTIKAVQQLAGDKCLSPIRGSVSSERRQQIIEEFEKAPAGTVLPAQILAGGTGLNIQAASVVIICEPQIKPSIENQAISRAYRMGQARNVLVYRLLAKDTVDERVTGILAEKQLSFDAFADKSKAGEESLQLDETTIGDIIQEEVERIRAEQAEETSENTSCD